MSAETQATLTNRDKKCEYGWAMPPRANKFHLYASTTGMSLCGRWIYWGSTDPDSGSANRDDCKACTRAALKHRLITRDPKPGQTNHPEDLNREPE